MGLSQPQNSSNLSSCSNVNISRLRLQEALKFYHDKNKSLREVSRLFNISKSTLQRAANGKVDFYQEQRRRKPLLSKREEKVVSKAVLEFSRNNTPLSRDGFLDLVQTYVSSLPPGRRHRIGFKNGRPGPTFLRNFLERHSEVTFKRRVKLEQARKEAMNPQNIAKHFGRLHQVYQCYDITSGEQVFNLDESDFSVRTEHRSRRKALFQSGKRSNSVEIGWSGNAEHITVMPVVSADGRAWRPLVVLLGKRTKWRILGNGHRETPSIYLPENAYVVYRDPAGVDSEIFLEWTKLFVEETAQLREKHKHLVLLFDSYGAHVSYAALKTLRDANIVAVGLPAHSSHRTQVLDYSVFSPFKTHFRNALNDRRVGREGCSSNDVYSLCEILHAPYKASLSYSNIVNGFKACGVWCAARRGIVSDVINAVDISNFEEYDSQENAHLDYLRLVERFKSKRGLLRSDGIVRASGCLDTRDGALLTSREVMDILQRKDEAREQATKDKEERRAAVAERKAEKERLAALKVLEKSTEQARKVEHQQWLEQRTIRALRLAETRRFRRDLARLKGYQRHRILN